MNRHPLHIQNRNDTMSILVARLLFAIEAVDTTQLILSIERHNNVETEKMEGTIPMEQWSAIVEESKTTMRHVQRDRSLEPSQLVPNVTRLVSNIETVVLTKCFDRKTRTVCVPMQTWANILAFRDDVSRSPDVMKAYLTEYYIRHGKFPNR